MESGAKTGIKLIGHKYDLVLKHPFIVSYGARTHQKTLVVEFKLGDHSGFGESPEIFYYNVNREGWLQKLDQLNVQLQGYTFTTPEELWEHLRPELASDPFLQNAIDQAAHDWFGKSKGVPLYKLWGLSLDKVPNSSFTIGLDKIEVMVQKIKEEDWPCYKIKLNAHDALEMVTELRKHTKATFRVDANCAWTVDQTIEYSKKFKELGVEFIEQPLAKDNFADMARIMKESAIPIIADESCQEESDLEKCQSCFHGVNIKLAKCGGLTPALRMIKKAKAAGLKVMVGCMIEGTVGISALSQLLPLLDYVDMDGAALIKPESDDAETGVKLTPQGVIFPPNVNGTGAIARPISSEEHATQAQPEKIAHQGELHTGFKMLKEKEIRTKH